MTFDIYGDRAVEAMALIREFARVEYWDYFKGDPERALEAFCVMQDAAEAKSAARIAELDAQLGKRPCQNNRCANLVAANTRIADLEAQVSALKAAGGVPPGYALVPLEPTPEMLTSAWNGGALGGEDDHVECWSLMLAAAPQAVEQTKPQEPSAYLHPTSDKCVSTDPNAYEHAIPLFKRGEA